MKHTPENLVALSPRMKPTEALQLLERTLAADSGRVRAVIYDLTPRDALALSEPTALENLSSGLYGAEVTLTVAGVTTHVYYYVDALEESGEGALLRRSLQKNYRCEPGDPYKLELTFT